MAEDALHAVRRLARRSTALREELERAVIAAIGAGHSRRAVAEAAGFANHRSIAQILDRRRGTDG